MNWSSDYLVVFATDIADAVVREHVAAAYIVLDIPLLGEVSLSLKLFDIASDFLLMLFDVSIELGHRIFYIFGGLNFGLDVSNSFHIDVSLFGI